MIKNINWIFFDLGSTLVDESDCYDKRYAEIVSDTGISYGDFVSKVIAFAGQNLKGDHEAARYYGLPLPKWHKELEKLYPNVPDVLSALVDEGYKLGVIANQSPGTKQRLENWGILQYFDIVLASAEEGVAKPDPEIFRKALSEAKCPPKQAVMVGDRLDNDIVPAKQIGMKTVWVKQGFARYGSPKNLFEKADYTINNITELIGLFQ